MIEYIYFVKCPNCDDEPFSFFDAAKEFACGCLSQKPIITQVEVNRNDFGECTDSAVLGTVWSWEDMMSDTEKEPSDKPSLLTKDFLATVEPENDPEFAALDNSVEVEDDDFRFVNTEEEPRKPIPEGMTIEQLVEEMEENEDMVECTWCNDLFPKDQCRYEVDLGYLCSRCEAAIKSRGETLTFRENNYWDFLDEEKESVKEYVERDPFDHHDPEYSDEEAADVLADEIDRAWDSRYDEVLDNSDFFNEEFADPIDDEDEVEEFIFDEAESVEDVIDILVKDEEEAITSYEEAEDKIEELSTEEPTEEVKEVFDHIKEEEEEHIEELETLLDTEEESLEEHVNEEHPAIESDQELEGTDNAVVDCKVADVITHSEDEKPVDCKGEKEPLEKPLTEALLVDCPECGAKKAFDQESGVCNNCGFII